MAIKWTSDNDQVLLLTLINCHNLAINYDSVSENWPRDRGEIPTARAIRERVSKIKNTNGVKSSRPTGSNLSTPRAPRTTGAPRKTPGSKASTAKSTAKKRKRNYDDDDDEELGYIPRSEVNGLQDSPSAGRGGRATPGKPLPNSSSQDGGYVLGSNDDGGLTNGGPVTMGQDTPSRGTPSHASTGQGMFSRTPVKTSADDDNTQVRQTPRRAASAGVAQVVKEEESDSQADSDASEWTGDIEV